VENQELISASLRLPSIKVAEREKADDKLSVTDNQIDEYARGM
jgi:hypothetical protein